MKRLAIVSGLSLLLVVMTAFSAAGGGSVWHFEEQEYQPGDIAEATTSVSWSHSGSLGAPEDGPFLIYLAPLDAVAETWPGLPDGSMPVGIVEIHLGPYLEFDGQWYGQHHAIARFEIPDVSPGEYQIAHCNSPCTKMLGDIIGGWGIHVVAGPNGRPPAEIADEVWSTLANYPRWTEPEPVDLSEAVAADREPEMSHPPTSATLSVESSTDPVSAPDPNQFAGSSDSIDSEPSTWAIGSLVTGLVALLALLVIPLVDRIGWFADRVLRKGRGRAKVEPIAGGETTRSGDQIDESIAPRR